MVGVTFMSGGACGIVSRPLGASATNSTWPTVNGEVSLAGVTDLPCGTCRLLPRLFRLLTLLRYCPPRH